MSVLRPDTISREGWLEKRSRTVKVWRKRWVVLQGTTLYSFKHKQKYEKPTEVVDLKVFSSVKSADEWSGRLFSFDIASSSESFSFVASSDLDKENWIKAIVKAKTDTKKLSRVEGAVILREKLAAKGVLRSSFSNSKGLKVSSIQSLAPGAPKALFIFLHGYDNHSGVSYVGKLLDDLAVRGVSGFAMDFTGHGLSDGLEGVVDYKQYIEDSLQFISVVSDEYPGVPFFLGGEAMGGGVALLTGIELQRKFRDSEDFKDSKPKSLPKGRFLGEVLLAPAIHNSVEPLPILKWMFRNILLPVTPQSRVAGLPVLTPEMISRVRERQEELKTDPLHSGEVFRLSTAESLLEMTLEIQDRVKEVDFPFLVFHGTKDSIIPVSGSKLLLEESKTTKSDKHLEILEGGFHDIMSELHLMMPEKYESFITWVTSRATTRSASP